MAIAVTMAATSRDGLLMPRCMCSHRGDSDEYCVDPTDEQRQFRPMTQTRRGGQCPDFGHVPVRNLMIAASSAKAILRCTRGEVSSAASARFGMLPHSISTFGTAVRFSPARSFLN